MDATFPDLERYAAMASGRSPSAMGPTLPQRIKALHVTTAEHPASRLATALADDRATQVVLVEALGGSEAMRRLQDEVFDVLLVRHQPDRLDALQWCEAVRAAGYEEPLLVLGDTSDEAGEPLTTLAFEAGADGYLCVPTTTVRALLWTAARAIERFQLVQEKRRLQTAEQQRLQHEHSEASRLLGEQRALIHGLESLTEPETPGEDVPLPQTAIALTPTPFEPLLVHYRDLLRAYVIMGAGNLGSEMQQFARLLTRANISAQQTMLLHVQALEELVRGLGARSARHVMTRADLLVLELMVHLADGYREQASEQVQCRAMPAAVVSSASPC